jgi:hypothetical protein
VLTASVFGMALGGWMSGAIRLDWILQRRVHQRHCLEPAKSGDCRLVAPTPTTPAGARLAGKVNLHDVFPSALHRGQSAARRMAVSRAARTPARDAPCRSPRAIQ